MAVRNTALDEAKADIIQQYLDGLSTVQIANHYNVDKDTIRRRLNQWGYETPKSNQVADWDKDMPIVLMWRSQGLCSKEIGDRLGVSRKRVWEKLKEYDLYGGTCIDVEDY